MKKLALLLVLALSVYSTKAQTINWSPAFDVSSEAFGNKAISLALNTNGDPMVLHGASGNNAGLYLTIMNGGEFGGPIPVTSDTNIFLSDMEGPTMAVQGDQIVVGYQISGEWSVGARIVVSNDGGMTWTDPIVLNEDPSVDFFMPCVGFGPVGNPFVGIKWGANPTLEGIMPYDPFIGNFTGPYDGGAPLNGDAVCECCPSKTFAYGGKFFNLIRNNNNNMRDMWLAYSYDAENWNNAIDIDPTDWITNTCPASGADYTITDDGILFATFMSRLGNSAAKVYYSQVDLGNMSLINTARIDQASGLYVGENYPDISSSDEYIVSAWESNNDGMGYDIVVAHSPVSQGLIDPYIQNVTESLDINGHKRFPSIIIDGTKIHLIFNSTSEGVVKYMSGTIIDSSIEEEVNNILDLMTTADSWVITGGVGEYNYYLTDINGRLIESGAFENNLQITIRTGLHILRVENGSYNQSFKLSK